MGGCEPLGRSAAPPGVLRSIHKPGPPYLKHNLIILSNFKPFGFKTHTSSSSESRNDLIDKLIPDIVLKRVASTSSFKLSSESRNDLIHKIIPDIVLKRVASTSSFKLYIFDPCISQYYLTWIPNEGPRTHESRIDFISQYYLTWVPNEGQHNRELHGLARVWRIQSRRTSTCLLYTSPSPRDRG